MRVLKIVFVSLISVGLLLTLVGFIMGMTFSDVKAFFTEEYKYEKQEQIVVNEEVDTIVFETDIKAINVKTHSEDFITIDHYSKDNEKWSFDIFDSTLKITSKQPFRLFSFSFGFGSKKYNEVLIYVPENQVYNFEINTNTGLVKLNDLKIDDLNIDVDTGDISLNNLTISGTTNLKASTGAVKIIDSALNELTVKTSTGKVYISDVTATSLKVTVSTSSIDLIDVDTPTIILSASTGSIDVSGNYSNYSLELKTSTGKVKVNDTNHGNSYNVIKGSNKIEAKTSTGSINIKTN